MSGSGLCGILVGEKSCVWVCVCKCQTLTEREEDRSIRVIPKHRRDPKRRFNFGLEKKEKKKKNEKCHRGGLSTKIYSPK